VIGLVIVLAAVTWGSVLLAQRIEARRETPGMKIKKAFRSLFSDLDLSSAPEGPRHRRREQGFVC
jgi:hypothetical protein